MVVHSFERTAGDSTGTSAPRVGVLVVAYNAAKTLQAVLDRLPPAFCEIVDHVLVSDDASRDETFEVGVAYRDGSALPLTVIRNPTNLGYGGNQKVGYRWAIERDLDIVVLLHGDGQYAPEVVDRLVQPLASGSADAVLGSRMMEPGSARAGGMPLYKLGGNRILSSFQNRVAGLNLTEWHSGYRAYRVDALADLPLASYSDDFDFDTEIILGLHQLRKRIVEVPVPTFYGDEICYVNGLKYAAKVTADVVRYRLSGVGFGTRHDVTSLHSAVHLEPYEIKVSPHSSHGRLLERLGSLEPSLVLDVGCSDGRFGELARSLGHTVHGIDVVKHDGVGERLDEFVEADLNAGLPAEVDSQYDVIVAADVLEHTIEPHRLLDQLIDRLAPDGRILASVPNFAHWYPRARVVAGRFDYDQRGLLDHGHVRFFTRRSFERLLRSCGLRIVRRETIGTPFELLATGGVLGSAAGLLSRIDRMATRVWPTLFGYQFVYELVRD